MTWDFGLGEPHPRGQYNATMAAAEVMTEGAWWNLGNVSTAARFGEPTVSDVDFPTVALTQAQWDAERRELHVALQAMSQNVTGQPTTLRVTGLADPGAFTATSPDGAPVETDQRGGDLVLHTTVGEHSLLLAPH